MGILATDENQRVTQFVEKPADPPGTLASMGIYVFGRTMLSQVLTEDSKRRDSSHDFGKDIIPRMVTGGHARLRLSVPGLLGRRRDDRGLLADADGPPEDAAARST